MYIVTGKPTKCGKFGVWCYSLPLAIMKNMVYNCFIVTYVYLVKVKYYAKRDKKYNAWAEIELVFTVGTLSIKFSLNAIKIEVVTEHESHRYGRFTRRLVIHFLSLEFIFFAYYHDYLYSYLRLQKSMQT